MASMHVILSQPLNYRASARLFVSVRKGSQIKLPTHFIVRFWPTCVNLCAKVASRFKDNS